MSLKASEILLTGGSGRLGTELRRLLQEIAAPTRAELDIIRAETIEKMLSAIQPKVEVHAAPFTDVAKAETDRAACWRVNVEGTRHVAQAAARHNVFLVHISTDYVFDGVSGGYKEEDPLGPPRMLWEHNIYTLSGDTTSLVDLIQKAGVKGDMDFLRGGVEDLGRGHHGVGGCGENRGRALRANPKPHHLAQRLQGSGLEYPRRND